MRNPEETSKKNWSAPTIDDLNTRSNEGKMDQPIESLAPTPDAVVGPS